MTVRWRKNTYDASRNLMITVTVKLTLSRLVVQKSADGSHDIPWPLCDSCDFVGVIHRNFIKIFGSRKL